MPESRVTQRTNREGLVPLAKADRLIAATGQRKEIFNRWASHPGQT